MNFSNDIQEKLFCFTLFYIICIFCFSWFFHFSEIVGPRSDPGLEIFLRTGPKRKVLGDQSMRPSTKSKDNHWKVHFHEEYLKIDQGIE